MDSLLVIVVELLPVRPSALRAERDLFVLALTLRSGNSPSCAWLIVRSACFSRSSVAMMLGLLFEGFLDQRIQLRGAEVLPPFPGNARPSHPA